MFLKNAIAAPRLACVGHAALDHVFGIDAFPAAPTKTLCASHELRGGGMAFNAAIAAARLGAQVRLLARVGDDEGAGFLRGQLSAEGVQAQGVEAVAGAQTSLAAVVVDAAGTRQIYIHRGTAIERAHALDLRQLHGAQVLLVDPRWLAGALAALRWARSAGVPSVLDADVAPREDLRRLVRLADWAVFSEPGLQAYAAPGSTVDEGLQQARDAGCKAAVVTLGEHGSRRLDAEGFTDCPAPRVAARDTTGAGDVFHAALAVALAEGEAAGAAVAFASAAAAFKCERGLGALGAPTLAQLRRWQRARPPQAAP